MLALRWLLVTGGVAGMLYGAFIYLVWGSFGVGVPIYVGGGAALIALSFLLRRLGKPNA